VGPGCPPVFPGGLEEFGSISFAGLGYVEDRQ